MQRSDGGWSQLSTLESDAYATGQALYALNTAGRMSATDLVYRKGVEYLLRTGRRRVVARQVACDLVAAVFQRISYGRDRFISAAGTAWASMALTAAVQPRTSTER
jgi:hypothetical protein